VAGEVRAHGKHKNESEKGEAWGRKEYRHPIQKSPINNPDAGVNCGFPKNLILSLSF